MENAYENNQIVPVTQCELDRQIIEDSLSQQFIYSDPELEKEIEARVKKEVSTEKAEAIAQLLCFIIEAKKPRLASEQIAWACGMYIHQGLRLEDLAKRHGISRQAFHKGAMQFAQLVGLDATRAMKFEETRETYRKSNYRNSKHE